MNRIFKFLTASFMAFRTAPPAARVGSFLFFVASVADGTLMPFFPLWARNDAGIFAAGRVRRVDRSIDGARDRKVWRRFERAQRHVVVPRREQRAAGSANVCSVWPYSWRSCSRSRPRS